MEPVPDWARMSLYMVVLLVSIALALSLTFGAPGTPSLAQASPPQSQLPATVPGLTRDEGVFLFTVADDGSRAVYFIAQNTRHSIWPSDVQLEQQLNPLWPARNATRDDVLAFAEGAPIGGAKTGLVKVEVPVEATADIIQDETPSPVAEAPVAEAPSPVAEAPVVEGPVVEAPSPVAETPSPVVEAPSPVAKAPSPVAEAPSPVAEAPSPVAEEVPSAVEDAPSPVADAESPVADEIPIPVASAAASSPMPHAPTATQDKPADFTVVPASPLSTVDLQPANAESTIYVLQSGDNLIHLSARYGTTVAAILDANKITNPNRVYVGQSLIIPATAPKPDVVESPTAPAPVASDLLEPVADSPTSEVATTYTVKAGDSAITIARKLGVDVEQLLATNAVFNRNRVYVGQVLTVPGA